MWRNAPLTSSAFSHSTLFYYSFYFIKLLINACHSHPFALARQLIRWLHGNIYLQQQCQCPLHPWHLQMYFEFGQMSEWSQLRETLPGACTWRSFFFQMAATSTRNCLQVQCLRRIRGRFSLVRHSLFSIEPTGTRAAPGLYSTQMEQNQWKHLCWPNYFKPKWPLWERFIVKPTEDTIVMMSRFSAVCFFPPVRLELRRGSSALALQLDKDKCFHCFCLWWDLSWWWIAP